MRRTLVMSSVLALLVGGGSLARVASASPVAGDTNPIGTLRWIPDNANEKISVPGGQFRLVVVYDRSLNATGGAVPLLGKGPFGAKIFTGSLADFRMVGHSPSVSALKEATGQTQVDAVDQVATSVAGDVRDGACSKLGTPSFSAAYSTSRTFFLPGTTPYVPISGGGTCERVDSSTALRDANQNILGYSTSVTAFAPGFWINVTWPDRTDPSGSGLFGGKFQPEVFYGALYDTQGEDGEWYETGDAQGTSKSVGGPGTYDYTFTFTANPGAGGVNGGDVCNSVGPPTSPAGTWMDIPVTIPEGTTKAVFKLFPHGDWDLRTIEPGGTIGDAGFIAGFEETETVPSSGGGNITTLTPGTFTMRACNTTGETSVMGAVILTPHLSS